MDVTSSGVPVFEADASIAGKLCSICQTAVIAGEQVVSCPHCALPFHAECWNENQGCSAYGCKGAPRTAKPKVDVEQTSNAWAGEKNCPSCGRKIKGNALKCRFCGASFETRDVISRSEYAQREYEGTEFASARNKCIALFLLAASGCLSPIALILIGILVANKNFMGLDYHRLPSTLKALLLSSIGISALMLVLLLVVCIFDK